MPLPAAPRPICPTVLWQRLTSERRAALMRAASVTTAVPCWSSCSTGFCRRACSSCSISKHSGAAKSSSWMAPNEVAIAATMSATRAGCVSSSRIGTPLMPTRSANSAALPSMTGSPASAPMLPSALIQRAVRLLVHLERDLPERTALVASQRGQVLDGQSCIRDHLQHLDEAAGLVDGLDHENFRDLHVASLHQPPA